MRTYRCLTLLLAMAAALPLQAQQRSADNTLTAKERKQGWVLLFDGKDLAGWKTVREGKPVQPGQGWSVADGVISLDAESKTGDIVTNDKYRNFVLKVDFRIFEQSNSGIKYYINDDGKGKIVGLGCEYQIIDDWNNPDARLADGKRVTAALYDVFTLQSPSDLHMDGFNTAMIVVKDGRVEHWLNGRKVLEYTKGSPEWKAAVAASKFRDDPGFAARDEGYILLQDHHSRMEFKNIKIKVL